MLNKNFWFRLSASPKQQQAPQDNRAHIHGISHPERPLNSTHQSCPLERRRKGDKVSHLPPFRHAVATHKSKLTVAQRHESNPEPNFQLTLSVVSTVREEKPMLSYSGSPTEVIHSRRTSAPTSRARRKLIKIKEFQQDSFERLVMLSNEKYAKKISLDVKQVAKKAQSHKKFKGSSVKATQIEPYRQLQNISGTRVSRKKHRPSVNYRPWSPLKSGDVPCEGGQDIDFYLQTTD